VRLKETETRLKEKERELEAAANDLAEAQQELNKAKAEAAGLPSKAEFEAVQKENKDLKLEVEGLRLLKAEETEAELAQASHEGDNEEALKAKITKLQKDKDQDHTELMMEMYLHEQEKNTEIEELTAKIQALEAQVAGL